MGIDHYVSGFTLSVLTFKILSRFRCAFASGLNLHINVNSLARYTKSTLLCFFLCVYFVLQVSIAGLCREAGALFYCGAATQIGSAGGALTAFILVTQVR